MLRAIERSHRGARDQRVDPLRGEAVLRELVLPATNVGKFIRPNREEQPHNFRHGQGPIIFI